MFKFNKKLKRTSVFAMILMGLLVTTTALAMVLTMENSGTQKDPEWVGEGVFADEIGEGFIQAAENDNYILYYEPQTLAIQVKDKVSGNIHSSVAELGDEVEGMNANWRGMMQSGITLELLDEKNNLKTWPLSTKNATVKIKEQKDGFQAQAVWPEGIGVTMTVTLTDTGIHVEIPEDGTWEEDDCEYTLQSIYVFPFMDANRGHDQNGYMFVPDGCGALIRTSVATISTEAYKKQVYGTDFGISGLTSKTEQGMLIDAENIYIPVYGMIQNVNKSGVAVIIEEGDEYAEIQAYASGITTDFNFITAKFIVRQAYQLQISQGGKTVPANQEERNSFDINMSFNFLSGEDANYIGIAQCYREYLIAEGVLEAVNDEEKDIPLKLEFIVSEQKEALIGTSTVAMTSAAEVDQILTALTNQGIHNIEVVLRGVSKEGATGVAPTIFDFESTVGSKSDWKDLIEKYQSQGIDIAFYCDFSRGYDDSKGYSNSDRVQSISKMLLQSYDNGRFTYLSPQFTANALQEYALNVQSISGTNLAVDTIGKYLYSNWNKNTVTTRDEAKSIFENLNIKDVELAMYTPNAYLFGLIEAAYDMPTDSSGYYIFTDTVPVLQMVLKGFIPMYGTGFNFHANVDADLLRCIEYGIYPSYYLTKQETIDMLDTASGWLYTSEYDLWRESIIDEYSRMNEALQTVKDEYITDRVVLADDVIQITYSNGVSIIVNYNDTAYTNGTTQVEAKGYLVIKDSE